MTQLTATVDYDYCNTCNTVDKDGQEYKSCDTLCCICRNAFMQVDDIHYNDKTYRAIISTLEHDGVEIYEQKYVKSVGNVLICVHHWDLK